MFTHKKIIWVMMLLISIATMVVIFLVWPKTKLSEIKIVNGNPSFLFIAMQKGFFEKKDLNVNLETMSPEDSISALLAGEIDYATFYGGLFSKPFIEVSLRGAPIKTVMLTLRHPTYFLIAQPDLEMSDLKTIGIHSRHSPLHYLMLKFIEENNLEVKIITPELKNDLWTGEKLRNLLFNKEVDAILSSFMFYPQPERFPILGTINYIAPSGLILRNDRLEQKPEEVQKIIRVMEKTLKFTSTNKEEVKKLILLEPLRLKETEENLKIAENLYPLIKSASDRRGVSYDEGAELLIKLVKAGEFETLEEVEKQIVTQEELDKVFDFRFVK